MQIGNGQVQALDRQEVGSQLINALRRLAHDRAANGEAGGQPRPRSLPVRPAINQLALRDALAHAVRAERCLAVLGALHPVVRTDLRRAVTGLRRLRGVYHGG